MGPSKTPNIPSTTQRKDTAKKGLATSTKPTATSVIGHTPSGTSPAPTKPAKGIPKGLATPRAAAAPTAASAIGSSPPEPGPPTDTRPLSPQCGTPPAPTKPATGIPKSPRRTRSRSREREDALSPRRTRSRSREREDALVKKASGSGRKETAVRQKIPPKLHAIQEDPKVSEGDKRSQRLKQEKDPVPPRRSTRKLSASSTGSACSIRSDTTAATNNKEEVEQEADVDEDGKGSDGDNGEKDSGKLSTSSTGSASRITTDTTAAATTTTTTTTTSTTTERSKSPEGKGEINKETLDKKKTEEEKEEVEQEADEDEDGKGRDGDNAEEDSGDIPGRHADAPAPPHHAPYEADDDPHVLPFLEQLHVQTVQEAVRGAHYRDVDGLVKADNGTWVARTHIEPFPRLVSDHSCRLAGHGRAVRYYVLEEDEACPSNFCLHIIDQSLPDMVGVSVSSSTVAHMQSHAADKEVADGKPHPDNGGAIAARVSDTPMQPAAPVPQSVFETRQISYIHGKVITLPHTATTAIGERYKMFNKDENLESRLDRLQEESLKYAGWLMCLKSTEPEKAETGVYGEYDIDVTFATEQRVIAVACYVRNATKPKEDPALIVISALYESAELQVNPFAPVRHHAVGQLWCNKPVEKAVLRYKEGGISCLKNENGGLWTTTAKVRLFALGNNKPTEVDEHTTTFAFQCSDACKQGQDNVTVQMLASLTKLPTDDDEEYCA